jgi:putative endonuclease
MFFTYILQSEKDQKYYYGSTANLELRIKAHIQGKVRSTKSRRPLKLVYSECFSTKKEAIQRELFFKSKAGYAWLKNQGII